MTRRLVVATMLFLGALSAVAPATSRCASAQRELPFEISSNKPYVQVRINGSTPRWFVLDTGCRFSSIIARACADDLHLKLENLVETSVGAGQGTKITFGSTPNVTLDVAGDTLMAPGLGVMPLEHVEPYEGRRLDGLLGEDFMRRHVVEIDYAKRRIRIYKPSTFQYSGRQPGIPITFDGGLVVAKAEMTPPGASPVACRVVIDTGVRTTFWYHPFVVARDLVASQPRVVTGTVGGGAGGESTGDIGRLERLKIGAVTMERPTVVFSRDTAGVFASKDEDGIVGGELLRRCKVTFDYSHQLLYLEPYANSLTDFDADMSGLFLVSRGEALDHVTIQSVADHTPAQEAGLLKGDEITGIDGRAASHWTLDEIRELFKHDGVKHVLGIQRGDSAMEVRLTLRRLV